jgi:translation initiation factor IF-1
VLQAASFVENSLQATSKTSYSKLQADFVKMPGQTVRSAAKNMSKGARAKASKNARRVEAALNHELDYTTYGKVTKALGNKMFMVAKTDKGEHLAHIRGKMARINAGDVVLLNERDYETRQGSSGAVYDIVAVFAAKDISKLIRTEVIPAWMSGRADADEGTTLEDLFDYDAASDDEEEDGHDKKNKKSHRKAGKNAVDEASDSDVDVDAI